MPTYYAHIWQHYQYFLCLFIGILLIFSCVAYSTDQHPARGQAHRFCLTCLFQPRPISHCLLCSTALLPFLFRLQHWPLEKMWPVHITEGSEFAGLFCLKWALCPFNALDIWDFIEKSWFSCSYVLWQGSQAEGDRMHLLLHHTREHWLCVPSKAWETEIATTLYWFLEKKKRKKRKERKRRKQFILPGPSQELPIYHPANAHRTTTIWCYGTLQTENTGVEILGNLTKVEQPWRGAGRKQTNKRGQGQQ